MSACLEINNIPQRKAKRISDYLFAHSGKMDNGRPDQSRMYPKEPMIAYFKEHLYQSTCEYEGKESA